MVCKCLTANFVISNAKFFHFLRKATVVPVIPVGHAESGAEQMRYAAGTVTLELLPETQQIPEESEETP